MNLPDLIARLEVAVGSDQELDAAIGVLVGYTPKEKKHYKRGYYPLRLLRIERIYPAYTGSLDAALTLFHEKPEKISTDPRQVCSAALKVRKP